MRNVTSIYGTLILCKMLTNDLTLTDTIYSLVSSRKEPCRSLTVAVCDNWGTLPQTSIFSNWFSFSTLMIFFKYLLKISLDLKIICKGGFAMNVAPELSIKIGVVRVKVNCREYVLGNRPRTKRMTDLMYVSALCVLTIINIMKNR